MRSPLYLRQLKRDLSEWVEEGTLDPDTAEYLYNSAGQAGPRGNISTIVFALGALLLGFAAMSFVAANFWAIPKAYQLGILIGSMLTVFAASAWLLTRDSGPMGHAAVLLGVALFGVNIMLIAQIYHFSAHSPDGVLLWGLGALLAGILIPSRAALGAAFVIGGLWTGLESLSFDVTAHTAFLPYWLVATVAAHALGWRPGFHLSMLTLILWLAFNTVQYAEALDWSAPQVVAFLSMGWLGIWALGAALTTSVYPYADALQRYGVLLLLISLFLLPMLNGQESTVNAQWIRGVAFVGVASAVAAALAWMSGKFGLLDVVAFAAAGAAIYLFPEVAAPDLALTTWLYSGFYMVVAVWLVCYGVRHDERFVVNIALVAFGAEALYIYLRTFDTLLNQSMFFAVGGVVLIVLGVTIEQIRRQLLRSDSGETGEEATA